MLIAAGVLSFLIWAYLVFARGGFWRIYPAVSPPDVNINPVHIAVIIPARDEADVVGLAIRSLLQQTGHHKIHIFLVDDASTDGTAQAARSAALAEGHAQNLTIIQGSPLSPGWSGKLWAMEQGINTLRIPRRIFFCSPMLILSTRPIASLHWFQLHRLGLTIWRRSW